MKVEDHGHCRNCGRAMEWNFPSVYSVMICERCKKDAAREVVQKA